MPVQNTHMKSKPLTVSEITKKIKHLIESEILRLEVEGEISNWTVSARGHAYFNLKDEKALIACVLFSGNRKQIKFQPTDGAKVVVSGRLTIYEARGQ